MKFPIPNAALDDRLAILGTAGSGKTYLALTAIERLLARAARVVLIDPLGVGWGLRLQADGKTASPFNIPIFGGAHGDISLTEHAGAIIGETVAKMRESCIITAVIRGRHWHPWACHGQPPKGWKKDLIRKARDETLGS